MKVLSLFDGISCGQLALKRAGIKVEEYYASEICGKAISVTMDNFPKTIQVGDVCGVKSCDFKGIDLLIGGSPCQDFSQASKERKGLEGVKSKLFFEYVRILKEVKPKYFLLENVLMEDFNKNTISEILNCEPIMINSSLVSAQSRKRLYWTNIPPIQLSLMGRTVSLIRPPKDKGIYLQDILTDGFADRQKSFTILEGYSRPNSIKSQDKIKKRYDMGFAQVVFDTKECEWNGKVRFLNQIELERLQTVPDFYTKILNRNEAAGVLGNGWTVDVIAHIFKGLEDEH